MLEMLGRIFAGFLGLLFIGLLIIQVTNEDTPPRYDEDDDQ